MSPMIWETDRLILRAFQDIDLQPFAEYRSDPEIAKFQSWDIPFTEEKAAKFIEEMKGIQPGIPGEWYQIAIELKTMHQLIGDCAFCILAEDSQQAEIGFTLAGQYHGKGYGNEAVTRLLDYLFAELNLHRVRAICNVDNLAAAKLLERVGMRREAEFIENILFKGEWISEYWYGILNREWTARGY
ncbi:MAG TPA: GNAT family N-acetyltransferase [Cyanobacteria bacterium UBA11369]|nr:GNAT family N-acetyltransferase [Cyanobacteria bacterium UBA11371]HBE36436.1 GNAT family N-acetyltransferase [Cyanobacteria bacterium UBA11368]HBE54332.1 GNAT family N-acetyltransferase [Cyanobacteria bacterium UBA11369]